MGNKIPQNAHWPAFAEQGTIWHDRAMRAHVARPSVDVFDFAQCFVGSQFQKYTRLVGQCAYMAALRPLLGAGRRCTCTHNAKVA